MKTLTSFLHSEVALDAAQEPFIQAIEAIAGSIPEDIIYVRTGGTEGLFREQFFAGGKLGVPQPVRLLTTTIDTCEGLLVQQNAESVLTSHLLHQ